MAKIVAGSTRESAKNVTIGALPDPIRDLKLEQTPTKREGRLFGLVSECGLKIKLYIFFIIDVKAQKASNFVCNNSQVLETNNLFTNINLFVQKSIRG